MATLTSQDKGEETYIHGFLHGALSVAFFVPLALTFLNRKRYLSEFGEDLRSEYGFAAIIVVVISYYFAVRASKHYNVSRTSAATLKKDSRPQPRMPL